MKKIENCIYILTNPQYPGYVKIGYASDLKQRISSLNTGALVEFSPYAVYETSLQNADYEIHAIIKLLNPILRASKFDNGKAKNKEFFKLEPEEAFELLEHIAKVSGTYNKVYRVTPDYQPIYQTAKTQEQDSTETQLKENVAENKKPVTIKFLYGDIRYANFTSWSDYTVQTVKKAIEQYGLQHVKNELLNPNQVAFHKKKRDIFADSEIAMQKFSHKKIEDGLWVLTNYSAAEHKKIIEKIVSIFPMAKSELIYV